MSSLGTFSPGVFCPGALLAGGIFVREGFCPGGLLPGGLLSGGLMPVPPNFNGVLPVPSMIYVYPAGGRIQLTYQERDEQKKQTKKETKLGPVAPRGVDPRSPNFQGM